MQPCGWSRSPGATLGALVSLCCVLAPCSSGQGARLRHHTGLETATSFHNEWLVRLRERVAPEDAAADLGYEYAGTLEGLPGISVFRKADHPEGSHESAEHLTANLHRDRRVTWAEQQFEKRRSLRGVLLGGAGTTTHFNDYFWAEQWYLGAQKPPVPSILAWISGTTWESRGRVPTGDLRVLPVYRQGVTGWGVRIVVLDDGLEWTHEDLRGNYDPSLSYDVNGQDLDPSPEFSMPGRGSHGTLCAGEISMAAGNGVCGVGVAFGSRIGGVRMLDGRVTDATEGDGLGARSLVADVLVASWGPADDGATVEGPGELALRSLDRAVMRGRAGRGAVFVWASGNGGAQGDHCGCDGYVSDVRTVAVAAAAQDGRSPWYAERCAAIMAAVYSSDVLGQGKIVSTTVGGGCSRQHGGTSAAAPLGAGIIALALEVNPTLTWRDVQYLVALSANPRPLDPEGWQVNGAGLSIHHAFGFGLMDAERMVSLAERWTTVPERVTCSLGELSRSGSELRPDLEATADFRPTSCSIRSLEHVLLTLSVECSRRGDLSVSLTSPSGTVVNLLEPRPFDSSTIGFQEWTFLSVLTWGEDPRGSWKAHLKLVSSNTSSTGHVGKLRLLLHGVRDGRFIKDALRRSHGFRSLSLEADARSGRGSHRGSGALRCP